MENVQKLGVALRNLRASKNMTQDEVAKLIGMTPKTVCWIEKGRQLSSRSLELYLEAVGAEKIIIL